MLSIVVPTKNEVENIRDTIYKLVNAMRKIHQRYEILILDSNSRDGTQYVAGRLTGLYPIRVINCGNLDLAQSIVKGLILSRGEHIIVTDGDGQHDIESIKRMWISKDMDIVINGASPDKGVRGFLSNLCRYTAKKVLPRVRIPDSPTSGFFMVKRSVIRDIKWNPIGFKVLLEILVKGKYNSVLCFKTKITERAKGSSKLGLKEMVKYVIHLNRLRGYDVKN